MTAVSRETFASLLPPPADPDALQAFHDLLAGDGVQQGLIGPRETPRLWERHIGNSAWVVLPSPGLVPLGAGVADIGSGAGLPGLVWAIVRPDLRVCLVEPLLRRSAFLSSAVAQLGLQDRVEVLRERAENLVGRRAWDVVTARAVAPLDRLLGWTVPLLGEGGTLLAMKGESAEAEIAAAGAMLQRLPVAPPVVVERSSPDGSAATRVIVVRRSARERG